MPTIVGFAMMRASGGPEGRFTPFQQSQRLCASREPLPEADAGLTSAGMAGRVWPKSLRLCLLGYCRKSAGAPQAPPPLIQLRPRHQATAPAMEVIAIHSLALHSRALGQAAFGLMRGGDRRTARRCVYSIADCHKIGGTFCNGPSQPSPKTWSYNAASFASPIGV